MFSGGKSRQSPQVSLSLCESAREISGVRAIRPQPKQKGGRGGWIGGGVSGGGEGGSRSGKLFLPLTYCSSLV